MLTRAEWYPVLLGGQHPSCQATHCFPCPENGTFSKSVSWNKIKCEVQSGVWGTAGHRGSRVPLGPAPGAWLRLQPSQLSRLTALWNLPVSSRMIYRAGHMADWRQSVVLAD